MIWILLVWMADWAEPWLRFTFAEAGVAAASPDLHLAMLCVVCLAAPRRLALFLAGALALMRSTHGAASPANLLGAYLVLAWLVLFLRRSFAAGGPLSRLGLSAFVFGCWLVLQAWVPGLSWGPSALSSEGWMRAFLTAGCVPVLLGPRSGWLPRPRGSTYAPRRNLERTRAARARFVLR